MAKRRKGHKRHKARRTMHHSGGGAGREIHPGLKRFNACVGRAMRGKHGGKAQIRARFREAVRRCKA